MRSATRHSARVVAESATGFTGTYWAGVPYKYAEYCHESYSRTAWEAPDVTDPSGSNGALHVFGVTLIGATPENGRKLLLTVGFIVGALLIGWIIRFLIAAGASILHSRVRFWANQVVALIVAVVVLIGVLSIWFDDPNRLATAAGLVTAGLAFALQRVITATAGYFLILRGKTFNVGDRIVMGGVRGDVVALSFLQTTIMEMGEPPGEQSDSPAMWVRSRQYTGRIVTITNAKVFDQPVYNYSRDFPYIFDEISLPIRYQDDRHTAEKILLGAVTKHTADIAKIGQNDLAELRHRYESDADITPRVFWRLTANWLEMTVRFLTFTHGTRKLKDAISRDVIAALDSAGIVIASSTYDIVGLPPVRFEQSADSGAER